MTSPQPTSSIEPRDTNDAEADVLARRPVEDRGQQGAALRDETDTAGPGDARRERRVQRADRVHDAEAVRADDADAVAACVLEHLALELDSLSSDLLEPGD